MKKLLMLAVAAFAAGSAAAQVLRTAAELL